MRDASQSSRSTPTYHRSAVFDETGDFTPLSSVAAQAARNSHTLTSRKHALETPWHPSQVYYGDGKQDQVLSPHDYVMNIYGVCLARYGTLPYKTAAFADMQEAARKTLRDFFELRFVQISMGNFELPKKHQVILDMFYQCGTPEFYQTMGGTQTYKPNRKKFLDYQGWCPSECSARVEIWRLRDQLLLEKPEATIEDFTVFCLIKVHLQETELLWRQKNLKTGFYEKNLKDVRDWCIKQTAPVELLELPPLESFSMGPLDDMLFQMQCVLHPFREIFSSAIMMLDKKQCPTSFVLNALSFRCQVETLMFRRQSIMQEYSARFSVIEDEGSSCKESKRKRTD